MMHFFLVILRDFPEKIVHCLGWCHIILTPDSKLIHGSCTAQIDFLRLQWLLGDGPQKVQIRGASNTGQGRQGRFLGK